MVITWCHQATSHYLNQYWHQYLWCHMAPLGHNELKDIGEWMHQTKNQQESDNRINQNQNMCKFYCIYCINVLVRLSQPRMTIVPQTGWDQPPDCHKPWHATQAYLMAEHTAINSLWPSEVNMGRRTGLSLVLTTNFVELVLKPLSKQIWFMINKN